MQEIAHLLKLSPVTVRRSIDADRLPAPKVGSSIRIRRDAIEGFLEPAPYPASGDSSLLPPGEPTSEDDPLLAIVGIADSQDGPTDISSNVDHCLAAAYAAEADR